MYISIRIRRALVVPLISSTICICMSPVLARPGSSRTQNANIWCSILSFYLFIIIFFFFCNFVDTINAVHVVRGSEIDWHCVGCTHSSVGAYFTCVALQYSQSHNIDLLWCCFVNIKYISISVADFCLPGKQSVIQRRIDDPHMMPWKQTVTIECFFFLGRFLAKCSMELCTIHNFVFTHSSQPQSSGRYYYSVQIDGLNIFNKPAIHIWGPNPDDIHNKIIENTPIEQFLSLPKWWIGNIQSLVKIINWSCICLTGWHWKVAE